MPIIAVSAWVIVLLAVISAWLAMFIVLGSRRRNPPLRLEEVPDVCSILPSVAGLTRGSICEGNTVEILQNGDGFFPAILRDIAAARASVHLETYVWSKGKIARQVAEALIAKAAEGVEVRLLVDALGAQNREAALFDRMKAAGVKVAVYCPLRPSNVTRWNNRTHRKILVVDGRIGHVFGHGIGDQWMGNGEDEDHWRDTAVRVEGPVAHALQSVFTENWVEETLEVIVGEKYFPTLENAGSTPAHVVSSSSGDAISAVSMIYSIALASARREVFIQNPYFAPRWDVVELMAKRVKEGVKIHLMLPGKRTDNRLVRHAGHYLVRGLLEAGIRVYEYERTLIHQKTMVVDGLWAHVGSTNFDARSLEINEEASISMIDEAVSKALQDAFEADLQHARELELAKWERRSIWHRVVDRVAYSIHAHL